MIEILVVFGIIAILAAILIPATGRVRENAKIAQSISNLREIGKAVQLYRFDNEDKFPIVLNESKRMWIEQLWPYSNPNQELVIFTTSSSPEVFKDTIYYTPMVEEDPQARSFGFNLIINYGFPGRRFQYSDSANVALVADSKTSSSLIFSQINFRNNGKANILFVDGHVESRAPNQVPESHRSLFWRGIPID